MIVSERQVISALQQSVISAVAQSSYPTLPIKFLNVTFNVPDNGKWLELVHIPNPPPDQTWGNEKIYRGLFRMILHWPNDGGGSYSAFDLVNSIQSRYVKGTWMNNALKLLNQPRVINVSDEEKELLLVISLEYSSFSW